VPYWRLPQVHRAERFLGAGLGGGQVAELAKRFGVLNLGEAVSRPS
jgi:hypothetical protein